MKRNSSSATSLGLMKRNSSSAAAHRLKRNSPSLGLWRPMARSLEEKPLQPISLEERNSWNPTIAEERLQPIVESESRRPEVGCLSTPFKRPLLLMETLGCTPWILTNRHEDREAKSLRRKHLSAMCFWWRPPHGRNMAGSAGMTAEENRSKLIRSKAYIQPIQK